MRSEAHVLWIRNRRWTNADERGPKLLETGITQRSELDQGMAVASTRGFGNYSENKWLKWEFSIMKRGIEMNDR